MWVSRSPGFDIGASKHRQRCQQLDVILTQNKYDIFQNTSQVISVMGWRCFLLRQEQKRLAQSQAVSCKIHLLASPCMPMSNSHVLKVKFENLPKGFY